MSDLLATFVGELNDNWRESEVALPTINEAMDYKGIKVSDAYILVDELPHYHVPMGIGDTEYLVTYNFTLNVYSKTSRANGVAILDELTRTIRYISNGLTKWVFIEEIIPMGVRDRKQYRWVVNVKYKQYEFFS